jgi:hypothetical protein
MKAGRWFVIVLIPLMFGVLILSTVGAAAGYVSEVDFGLERNILNASVQIYMYSLIDQDAQAQNDNQRLTIGEAQQRIAGQQSYCLAHGLGTLVLTGQGLLIVTHDHWADVLESADLVQFRDADGKILQTVTGLEFRLSILYRDTGTLVLIAPAGVHRSPASLGESDQVPLDGKVLIVRQNPDGSGRLQVIETEVKSSETFKGLSAWMLDTLNGDPLVRGDSGGGVWLDGKLVGNLWARQKANTNRWGFTQKEVATSMVYAAQYPARIQPALAEALQTASGAEQLENTAAMKIE